jgi:phospholipid-binding lipoprotein MlaA
MNKPNRSIAPALALCAVILAGCAAAPSKVDPLEPWNRGMYSIHEAIDGTFIKPFAQAYVRDAPELTRTAVSNFFGNIDDFFTGINDVLQGKGDRAGDAFGRVLLNSTFGLGGMFDLASMMGITKDKNDFGLTLGKWGAPDGAYLFIPLFGPTTVRDGTGAVIRIYASPTGYISDIAARNAVWGLNYLDTRAQALQAEGVLDTAAIDKYRFLRNAYLRARRYQLYDGKPPPELEQE